MKSRKIGFSDIPELSASHERPTTHDWNVLNVWNGWNQLIRSRHVSIQSASGTNYLPSSMLTTMIGLAISQPSIIEKIGTILFF